MVEKVGKYIKGYIKGKTPKELFEDNENPFFILKIFYTEATL